MRVSSWLTVTACVVAVCVSLIVYQAAQLNERGARTRPHSTRNKDTSYTLGICSSVKDDARWLVEWVEFHRLTGVDQMFIIDDGSSDATLRILQHYSRLGVVTIIPGTVPNGDPRCANKNARDSAYVAMCYDHAAPHLDWMVIMDSDEYLYPRQGCSTKDYVSSHCSGRASHVVLYWEMFGGGGFSLHPHGMLTENFLTSGGDCSAYSDVWGPGCNAFAGNCKECRHTKYIANTKSCLQQAAHCSNHLPGRLQLARDSCETDPDSVASCLQWWGHQRVRKELQFSGQCCSAGLALHHYAPKSEEARRWRAKRRMRNGLNEDQDASPGMEKRDLNWVLSPGVLKYVRTLRGRVAKESAALELTSDTRLAVSPDVSFVADSRCFFERGFRYTTRELDSAPAFARFCKNEVSCCQLCGELKRDATKDSCIAFTYNPAHQLCEMFGYKTAEERMTTWPPNSLPLARQAVDGFISGVRVEEPLC